MKKIIIITLIIFTILFAGCSIGNNASNLKDKCIKNGGNFIEEHNECEGISNETCQELGGEFNNCASACRHDETAQICTMQCVLVCKFS